MKKLVLLVVLIVIFILVYKYYTKPSSEEDSGISDLEKEFKTAQMEYLRAGRGAGLAGIDTTSGAQMSINIIKRVKEKLIKLKEQLTSEEDIKRAEDLEDKINDFMKKHNL